MLFDERSLNMFGKRAKVGDIALENNQFGNMVNCEIIQNVQNVIATSKPEKQNKNEIPFPKMELSTTTEA